MNCEWAEGYLSAYLDDTLDPPMRAEVSAHLETCAHCRDLLAEYRRYDELLARAPRIAPSEALRARIFSSPEYAAILRDATRRERRSQPVRASSSFASFAAPPSGAAFTASSASAPTTPSKSRRTSAALPSAASKARTLSRLWLPIAAMVVIALGLALLFRQGIAPTSSRAPVSKITTPVEGPTFSHTPLAAGSRLVFAHDGALWSAAEVGPNGAPGDEQRLTPPGVTVVAWNVSPIVNGKGGSEIAYIDGATGALHLVRSDRQADSIFATAATAPTGQTLSTAFWGGATGQAIRAGLSWSPDGAHLAYVSAHGATLTLHVLDLISGPVPQKQADHMLSSGVVTAFAWSAQSDWLAYAQTTTSLGNPGIWLFSVASGQTRQLAAQANPLASGAYGVMRLAITPGRAGQTATSATWATAAGGVITGVFVQPFTAAASLRLTPATAHFAAADVSIDGSWLLGDGPTLVRVTTPTDTAPTPTPITTLASPIIRIIWSPNGAEAAIQTQTTLTLWGPAGQEAQVKSFAGTVPAWSADGGWLAYQAGAAVAEIHITPVRMIALPVVAHVVSGQPVTLQWAPDVRALAIASANGVSMTTISTSTSVIDRHAASDGALTWSVAG